MWLWMLSLKMELREGESRRRAGAPWRRTRVQTGWWEGGRSAVERRGSPKDEGRGRGGDGGGAGIEGRASARGGEDPRRGGRASGWGGGRGVGVCSHGEGPGR